MLDIDFEDLYDQVAELNLRMMYLMHRVQFVRRDGERQTVVTAWARYQAERDAFLREVSDGRYPEEPRAAADAAAPAAADAADTAAPETGAGSERP